MRRGKKQHKPDLNVAPQHSSGLDAVLEPGASQQLCGTDVLRLTLCWAAAVQQPMPPRSAKASKASVAPQQDTVPAPPAAFAVLDASMYCFGSCGSPDLSPTLGPESTGPSRVSVGTPDRWGSGSPKKDPGLAVVTTTNPHGDDASPYLHDVLEHVSVARPYVAYMTHHRRKHLLQHEQQQQQQQQQGFDSDAGGAGGAGGAGLPPQLHSDGYYRGDTFELDLAEVPHDAEGFLVSAVLYNKDIFLSDLNHLHMRVETVQSSMGNAAPPSSTLSLQANVLCNSAVHFPGSASLIVLMIRKRLAGGTSSQQQTPASPQRSQGGAASQPAARPGCYFWELVCLDELQEGREVAALQDVARRRGLADGDIYGGAPASLPYALIDPGQAVVVNRSRRGSEALDTDDEADGQDFVPLQLQGSQRATSPTHTATSDGGLFILDHNGPASHGVSPTRRHNTAAVAQLLSTVPRVVREERRRYNVGRPANTSDPLNDCGTSDDEQQTIVASMKAVAPLYDAPRTVRFGTNTYNVGSEVKQLKQHLVDHRVEYELAADDPQSPRGGASHETIWRLGAAAHHMNVTPAAPTTNPTSSNGLGLSTSGRLGNTNSNNNHLPLTPNYSALQGPQKPGGGPMTVVNRELEEEADLALTSPLKPNMPLEMMTLSEHQQRQRALSSSWQSYAGPGNGGGRTSGGGAGRSPNTQSFASTRNRRQSVAGGGRSGLRRGMSTVASPVPPPGVDAHAPTPFRNGEMPRGSSSHAVPHAGAARLDSRGSVRGIGTPAGTTSRTRSIVGGRSGTGGRLPGLSVNTTSRRQSIPGGNTSFEGLTPSILVSPDAAGGRIPVHYQQPPVQSSSGGAAAASGGGQRKDSFDDDRRADLPFPVPPAYTNSNAVGGGYQRATSPTSPISYTQAFQSQHSHHGSAAGGGRPGALSSTSPTSPTGSREHSLHPQQQQQYNLGNSGNNGVSGGATRQQPPSSAPANVSHRTSPRTSPREGSLVSIRDADNSHGGGSARAGGGRTYPQQQHVQLSRDVMAALSLPPPIAGGGKPPPHNNNGSQLQPHRQVQSPFYSGGGGGGLLPNVFNTNHRNIVPSSSLSLSLSTHQQQSTWKGVATTITTANRIKMATERARRRRQRHSSLRTEQAQVLGSLQQMLSGLLPMLNLQPPPSTATPHQHHRGSTQQQATPPTSLVPRPPPIPRTSNSD